MYCPKCGTELKDNSVFCKNCGTPLNEINENGIKKNKSKGKRKVVVLVATLALAVIFFLFLVGILAALGYFVFTSSWFKEKRLYSQAQSFEAEYNYDDAILAYESLLEIDDTNGEYYLALLDIYEKKAEDYLDDGDEEEALSMYKKAFLMSEKAYKITKQKRFNDLKDEISDKIDALEKPESEETETISDNDNKDTKKSDDITSEEIIPEEETVYEDEYIRNTEYSEDEIINWTMFSAMPGSEIVDGNDVQEIIAKKTGVRVKETWLTGQTAAEAIGSILASGELPDFIDGGYGMLELYEADTLVAWDPYLDKYPNLKELYTDKEWEQFRQADGKIYWANVFNNTYGESKATGHNDEAFWIQVRVLEWAGYPYIETLDDYFDLIESYYDTHKSFTDPDGHTVNIIPYTILCEDWRYFCLENAPMFLDGFPNDGSVIVDPNTMKVVDYNTTPTAKTYFSKLNEEYQKGIIDKDFATQTYDQYIEKLSSGAVLGMVDQNWDFNYTVTPVFASSGLDNLGCEYVPLGLTVEGVTEQRWHSYGDTIDVSSGCAVTTSCADPDRAFQFLNDILNQDIHDLRFWGVEGVDYLVDENGMYYRTQEMRNKLNDSSYRATHMCNYSYMPQWLGTSRDGKNAMQPAEQASEFYAGLSDPLAKCFKAYNAGGYPDMIGSIEEDVNATHPWFPMWSWSNELNNDTPGGVAWGKMGETKHKWLPKVVMASSFESEWGKYLDAYKACKPEDFLNEAQTELEKRLIEANE